MTSISQDDQERRKAAIDGLHALADYFTEHPDVPFDTANISVQYSTTATADFATGRAEVDRVAALIGVETSTLRGHYRALRMFGPVQFVAVAIPATEAVSA